MIADGLWQAHVLSSIDLTDCDREPIVHLERIQSFGFLLALSIDWTVARASANLEAHLGIAALTAIGGKFDKLVLPGALDDIRGRVSSLHSTKGVERLYALALSAGRPLFDVALHFSGSLLILEAEPSRHENNRADAVAIVRRIMSRLNTQSTLDEFHRDAAHQIRAMTDFGRVMIYRFAPAGEGEVIAESLDEGMESFVGLHYPASDIPVQARELYLRNPFRIIADPAASTVPLLPEFGVVQPLDLSRAMTRAVSPAHIEYLRNMGVAASLSISIIVDGALWGLIACHSPVARLPSFMVRTAAELFGQLYSLTLESRLRQSQYLGDRLSRDIIDHIMMAIAGNGALLSDAAWLHDPVRKLIECDGVATLVQGRLSVSGSAPPRPDIEAIAIGLDAGPAQRIFATDHLGSLRPEAGSHAGTAAGVLAIPISRAPRDYILLFRRELIQDVRWAGNPHKPVLESGTSMRLSPRKSFDEFSENVRGRSRPFTEFETRTAEILRTSLVDVALQISSDIEQERTKAAERQELLIAELNHRVRNILALVLGLVNQTAGTAFADVSAYAMSLKGRIQAIALAQDQITRQNWGPSGLAALIEAEVSGHVHGSKERLTLIGPDVFLDPQALSTLSLVIHELAMNSAKYGALSAHGRVTVTLDRQPGSGLLIGWREIGGPTVEPPQRRGFGSVIIERFVPSDLQGTADVRYLSAGLEVDLFVPESHIAMGDASKLAASSGSTANQGTSAGVKPLPLTGLSVLLLEDNLIIALEGEQILLDLGAAVVHTASSVARAESILTKEHVDFAVLDINIGRHSSLQFADSLNRAGIPFVFASGYGDEANLGGLHQSAVTVTKPYTAETLAAALRRRAAGRDTTL
jgi:light-regulated signal transduction histidine kinase (bacteriophytochrome)/CheY-like chemotaxis protein